MATKILTKKERLKLVKKIDDGFAMELYERGLSDEKIAKHFGMSRGGVYIWRKKNGLVANHKRPDGEENLTEEELKEKFKSDVIKQKKLQLKRYQNNPEPFLKYSKKIRKIPRHRNRIIKYFKKLNATPERKEYKNKWNNKPENLAKKPLQNKKWREKHWKEYYEKNRDKLLKEKKEYYKRDYVKEWDKLRKKFPKNHPSMEEVKEILSNSIAPRSNSASQVTSDGFNRNLKDLSSDKSQILPKKVKRGKTKRYSLNYNRIYGKTSLNSDIMFNFPSVLQSREQLNNG